MKKVITLVATLLALGASSAMAQGLNLYWSNCSDGGATSQTFACSTNSGAAFVMVMTAVLPTDMTDFLGTTAVVDVRVGDAALPDWWQAAAGGCRANAIGMSFDPNSNTSNCGTDVWGGVNPTTVFTVQPLRNWPNDVRLNGAGALVTTIPLAADGTEYYIGRITISRTKSTGTGSCAGCLLPACIVFNESKFQTPGGANDVLITNEATNQWVTWNGPWPDPSPFLCPDGTPAMNRTWGAVKNLYR